ncbi:hypothetical protein BU26DRAFT_92451 [Trematosphaeria pertusa]|uniref:Golgi apparatus membrane protein TVP18 n=1 Tax=Trematosphaeria pertusa TaxID=390896 RepID=A0A6A6I155_9PLEO|nr:uncharacterized protein BU26DRAFT_92451 [Trematosphaeria pertusa]KAF2244051.1 hypothetical protein BU26DRAFT_92451 [Trematosphaeria pertusa]
MTLAEEFRSRNFSIYGQWTGVLCIFLCFALGVANIFHVGFVIAFSIICLVCAFLIIFIEIPLLLRICPTSPKFDAFIRRFETNFMRAAIYGVMSLVQWLSLLAKPRPTSLIAAAIFLMFAAAFYALAGIKGQAFQGSKTLGGQGVAQMII